MHLPSPVKAWQIPLACALPIPLPSPPLCTPLEVQATSYFAASDKIVSFSIMESICITFATCISPRPSQTYVCFIISIEHMFVNVNNAQLGFAKFGFAAIRFDSNGRYRIIRYSTKISSGLFIIDGSGIFYDVRYWKHDTIRDIH